jgi:Kef-type K+ transport system membrane component KefB
VYDIIFTAKVIIVGILLGPGNDYLVPFQEALRTLGQFGLLLLVLEGGLSIDLKVRETGGLLQYLE